MRYNGDDNEIFSGGILLSDREISFLVACFFVLACFIAGAWDLCVAFFGNESDTVSEMIRSTALAYPMEFILFAFFAAHFWRVR